MAREGMFNLLYYSSFWMTKFTEKLRSYVVFAPRLQAVEKG